MSTSPSQQQQQSELMQLGSVQQDSLGVTRVLSSMGAILRADVFIPSAAVKKLNSSPVIIVPAPGSGFFLNVYETVVRYKFGTVPYATATNFIFLTEPAADLWDTVLSLLPTATQSQIEYGTIGAMGAGNIWNIPNVDNQSFSFAALGGDPTAGDGTLRITAFYTIESTN